MFFRHIFAVISLLTDWKMVWLQEKLMSIDAAAECASAGEIWNYLTHQTKPYVKQGNVRAGKCLHITGKFVYSFLELFLVWIFVLIFIVEWNIEILANI